MTWTNKVTWSEGLFLRPQLFQQQERYLEQFAHKRVTPLTPFFWGFSEYRIDTESLLLGKLVIASASGIYQDGTPFETPSQTTPPPPLTLLNEHVEQIIHLALPIRTPNSEETNFDDAPGSSARYSVFDYELRDSNSVGQGPKEVQLSHLRLRLVPQKELTSAWMGLPIAKVVALRSDGSAELETNFIPPINHYATSERLEQWLTQIHGNTIQRAQTLSERLSGQQGNASSAEVTDFLLLQILNRYEPQLQHYLVTPETSPEQLYLLLRSMAGELSTYVRTTTRRSNVHPKYEHIDPYASFNDLVTDVRELLNNLLIRSAQNIKFIEKQFGLKLASVDPAELKTFSSVVLAVSAQMPLGQLAQQFPIQGKIGPADRLPELVRLHLPGITLTALPVPPRQIPFNSGYIYFQLEPRGPLWDHLLTNGGIGLHIASDIPGLQIELWGIRT